MLNRIRTWLINRLMPNSASAFNMLIELEPRLSDANLVEAIYYLYQAHKERERRHERILDELCHTYAAIREYDERKIPAKGRAKAG